MTTTTAKFWIPRKWETKWKSPEVRVPYEIRETFLQTYKDETKHSNVISAIACPAYSDADKKWDASRASLWLLVNKNFPRDTTFPCEVNVWKTNACVVSL